MTLTSPLALTSLGSNRDQLLNLEIADRDRLLAQHVLVGDSRRWRPRWFDGRFLAASDLQAEQNYFLVRQSDLGRASGSGVADGLMVSATTANGVDRLQIEPGSGITDTGELIVLPDPLAVDPADVPEIERLDAAFGLQVIPNEPGRNRTGLYILALRLVEWTANPIGAYPTSITGKRTVEDGTIVEGIAVSLIPYPDTNNDESWDRRRARVAREIFAEGRDWGLDSGVLPLAMVALRGNLIEWVDPFMLRRETGAERPAGMDFGFGARALREAHLLQYQAHLSDVLDIQNGQSFAAASYFDALPPVGQFPASSLNADDLTQRFFPAGIEVELSFLPEDELPAVIEEALLLPPIDLTDSTDQLAGTGVIVLVPLSRADFNQNRSSLPDNDSPAPVLKPAFLQLQSLATPKQLLLARQFRPVAVKTAPDPQVAAWQQLLRTALARPLLWYVRRRNLPIPSNVAGTPVSATASSVSDPHAFAEIVKSDDLLSERVDRITSLASPASAVLVSKLSDANLVSRPALVKSIVASAAGDEGTPLQPDQVVTKLAPVTDPNLGQGLTTLENQDAALGRTLATDRIAETGTLAEIDKLARDVPPDKMADFATELKAATKKPSTLSTSVAELRNKFVTP
jgi:hypothetical protein